MTKRKAVDAVIAKLQSELDVLARAAKEAHAAATHEESRPEDQYDTRGLEASYLAGAQFERAGQIARSLAHLKHLQIRELGPGQAIVMPALVELERTDTPRPQRSLYLLLAQGGGVSVALDGRTIQVITPQSPVGEALMGRSSGESFEVESGQEVREFRVVSVA